MASAPSAAVILSGKVEADTVTGAMSRKANGILQAAGEIEQRGKLEDVVGQHDEGVVAAQALARRIADARARH